MRAISTRGCIFPPVARARPSDGWEYTPSSSNSAHVVQYHRRVLNYARSTLQRRGIKKSRFMGSPRASDSGTSCMYTSEGDYFLNFKGFLTFGTIKKGILNYYCM